MAFISHYFLESAAKSLQKRQQLTSLANTLQCREGGLVSSLLDGVDHNNDHDNDHKKKEREYKNGLNIRRKLLGIVVKVKLLKVL